MFSNTLVLVLLFSVAIAKREMYNSRERSSEEIDDLYFGRNGSRVPLTTTGKPKGDVVVEKFVETLMSSERYLKLVETVDSKVTHLDATFRERSNSILKYLSELTRLVRASPANVLELALKSLKTDLDKLKNTVLEKFEGPKMRGDNLLGKCLRYHVFVICVSSYTSSSLRLL